MSQHSVSNSKPGKVSQAMFAGLLIYLLLGAAGNFYGPALVYIAAETNQSAGNLGMLFVLQWSGFVASTAVVNRVAKRIEVRHAVMLGCSLIALGEVGFVLLPFPFNLAFPLLIGFGGGTLEVLLNRLIEFLAVDAPAAALTRLHATYGLGAVVIPLMIAGSEWLGWNWRAAGMVLILFAVANMAIVLRWPKFEMPHGVAIEWSGVPWRSIILFVLMIVIYVGLETGVGGWATTFFAKMGSGPVLGAIATSLFFLTFTFGRVVLASAPERLGYDRTVRFGTALGALLLTLTIVPQLALIGFTLAGFAFSVVFTTQLAWAARRHPQIRAQMASVSIASAGLGGVIIPYLIGVGVDTFGAWSLTPMMCGIALVVSGLSLFEPGLKTGRATTPAVGGLARIDDA